MAAGVSSRAHVIDPPQRMLRVLFTVPWARRSGGAEEMLQGLIEDAGANGLEPELVFLEDGPWAAELRAAGVRVEVVPAGRLRQPLAFLRTVRALARIIRARRPELIVNWTAKTQLYGAPAALLAGRGRRVLWWQHSIPRGHWLDRAATLLPARAIGCTSQAAAEAQQLMRPRRPTFVVAAGTRDPRTQARPEAPAAIALPAGVPVVGMVGRLQPWKGQDRLLRAVALLRPRPLHLLLVGGDSFELAPKYARTLPALVQELGLTDSVSMTGEVAEAGPYIERMDILVNASEQEPFGIVLLEAMARAVAVVAVDSGGPREIVQDGLSGVLARSGDPADLAEAVARLLDSEPQRATLAAAGRERFERLYTREAMGARFAGALRGLAGERAREG